MLSRQELRGQPVGESTPIYHELDSLEYVHLSDLEAVPLINMEDSHPKNGDQPAGKSDDDDSDNNSHAPITDS